MSSATSMQEPSAEPSGRRRLLVLSNRLPFTVKTERGRARAERSTGGLVAALEPALRRRGGAWLGWAGGALPAASTGVRAATERRVVLAATHSFFDQRLLHPGGRRLFELLEGFGERARVLWDQPDAGPWELRTRSHVHTFSAVMCWAACDRLARIAARLGDRGRANYWRVEADALRGGVLERAWSQAGGLGFVAADDPRFTATVAALERELCRGPYLLRYALPDDFGPPRAAFNVCTFWYVSALAALGRRQEARELFENMLRRRNRAGLLSEDLDPGTEELWGKFPQTYSFVGLINAAMRLSKRWEDAF